MENLVTINNTKKNVLEFDVSISGLDTKDVEVKFVIKTKKMDLVFAAKHEKGDTWSVNIPELPMVEKTTYKSSVVVIADGYYFEPMKGSVNVVGSHEVYSSTPKNTTLEPTSNDKKEEKSGEKSKEDNNTKKTEKEDKKETPKEEGKDVKKKTSKFSIKETSVSPPPEPENSVEHLARKLIEETKTDVDVIDPKSVALNKILQEKATKVTELKKEITEPTVIETTEMPTPTVVVPVDDKKQKVIEVLESVGIQPRSKRRRKFSINN